MIKMAMSSGIGTIAAVAALAATLFPLIFITCYKLLIAKASSFPGNKPNLFVASVSYAVTGVH